MDFKKIEKTKDNLIITMKVGDHEVAEELPFTQEILNTWVFKSKAEAVKYYNDSIVHNDVILKNNEDRIGQMPLGVDSLAEFTAELKKKQSIGKKLSKEMDKVIKVWENRQDFLNNIASIKKANAEMEVILKELKKVK